MALSRSIHAMWWPSILLRDGRPRFPEVGRPPGEDAPGPAFATFAALIGIAFAVMLGLLVMDPHEDPLTRIMALLGMCGVPAWSLRVLSTWYAYRGHRSAFERNESTTRR